MRFFGEIFSVVQESVFEIFYAFNQSNFLLMKSCFLFFLKIEFAFDRCAPTKKVKGKSVF